LSPATLKPTASKPTGLPAEIRSESFDLVACGEERPEDGGIRPSELVALVSVVNRQLLLAVVLDNSTHIFDILNATLYFESASSAVVFLSVKRKVPVLLP
jgi:hypothetical protein